MSTTLFESLVEIAHLELQIMTTPSKPVIEDDEYMGVAVIGIPGILFKEDVHVLPKSMVSYYTKKCNEMGLTVYEVCIKWFDVSTVKK
jgi:hypothetical protein